MNRVLVRNLQAKVRLPEQRLRRLIRAVLVDQGVTAAEVSVMLVNDQHIQRLNRRYRGKNRSTDVLAFRMGRGPGESPSPQILGDVVVSVETARRTARQLGISWQEEVCRYLVHGTLHLLGYEDVTRRGFCRLHRIQEELLKRYASPLPA